MKLKFRIAVLLLCFISKSTFGDTIDNEVDQCSLPENLVKEIESYAPTVNKIINETVNGLYKGTTWQELATFVDKFGPRLSGSQVLENAIDYMLDKLVKHGLENVHGEEAVLPHWVRGKESATLLQPRVKDIAMLGLGYSVGTPTGGITALAIVLKSFDELRQRRTEVPGKIVVYNQDFVSYEETVIYRSRGASEAAKFGAVAVLIRSITPVSIYSPHTGMMTYQTNITKIPAACITIEDAAMLNRMADRGETMMINIRMEAQSLPAVKSRNTIAEIIGAENPEKVVVVSGHLDSWDVGQGAMDDGGGAFISWNSLRILKALNLRPRRTIRAILWTGEEIGIVGAHQYIQSHKADRQNLQFVMESDIGTFTPIGLAFTGSKEAQCILKKIMNLLEPINATMVRNPNEGPDITEWVDLGVPGASLWNDNGKYFWYHHSNGDTMSVEDPHALDLCAALFAAVSYVMAQLSVDLPHNN
ncbi:carboxypeptidase Q-like [Neodiprion fabricii]|uniref:carboxypeptidase Q-like n=1 Tax=Neodiprion fabricii TaxID=2872261 RepID=UPI001ED94372|nr:carboxypeptidase Q-like [Neodiprion fabricii]